MSTFAFTCPGLRLYNLSNHRWHPLKVAKYNKTVKHTVWAYAMQAGLRNLGPTPPARARVTITRIGPKALDDDGAVSSVKPALDALKRGYCGLIEDDSVEHCQLEVVQRKGAYGVEIVVESIVV